MRVDAGPPVAQTRRETSGSDPGAGSRAGLFEETLGTLLERALDGVARVSATSSADGASMLNEHGFFGPALPAEPTTECPEAAGAEIGTSSRLVEAPGSPTSLDPVASDREGVRAEPEGAERSRAGIGHDVPAPACVSAARRSAAAPPRGAVTAAPGGVVEAAARSLSDLGPERPAVAASRAGRTAPPRPPVAVTLGPGGDRVSLSVRIDRRGGDETDDARLRDEVAALLARHGLVLGNLRINGRPPRGRAEQGEG